MAKKAIQPDAPKAPTADDVAARAMCLLCEFYRAWAEAIDRKAEATRLKTTMNPVELHGAIQAFVRARELEPSLTASEKLVIDAPLGRLKVYQIQTATWRAESLEVLVWALGGMSAMPGWDTNAGRYYTAAFRPELVLAGKLPAWLMKPTRRDSDAAQELLDTCALWTFRARAQRVLDGGYVNMKGRSKVIGLIVDRLNAAESKGLVQLRYGDLQVKGIGYWNLAGIDPFLQNDLDRRIPLRHHAAAWVAGGGDWSTIELNTPELEGIVGGCLVTEPDELRRYLFRRAIDFRIDA